MTDNPLNFPTTTIVAQTVPKNAFYKRAKSQRATALKDFLTTTFERIRWLYKLHSSTINVADGKQVHEIDVFSCQLKKADYDKKMLSEMDALIPRQTIYLFEHEGVFELLAQYKTVNKQGDVIIPYKKWEQVKRIDLSDSPLPLVGYDMDALYAHFIGQLSQLGTTTDESYQEANTLRQQYIQLKQQCDALLNRKKKEKQYNRRLEIRRQLKPLQEQLHNLETKLNPNRSLDPEQISLDC